MIGTNMGNILTEEDLKSFDIDINNHAGDINIMIDNRINDLILNNIASIYKGIVEPSNDIGENGDLYIVLPPEEKEP